jgi:hypothetical protein
MHLSSFARRVIAQNILYQLGGSSLLTASIQANSFWFGSNGSVTFHFKGFRGANKVKIFLNDNDLYTMEFMFFRPRLKTEEVVRVYEDIPLDTIKAVFEEYIKKRISL